MNILVDTREHDKVIESILSQFDEIGVVYDWSKGYVGDYYSLDNARYVIDRKHSISEICGNVTGDHERFKREILRAKRMGIHICILIEDKNARTLSDIQQWFNPRTKKVKSAVNGAKLYKILYTINQKYPNVSFEFTDPKNTGYTIYRLLKEHEL